MSLTRELEQTVEELYQLESNTTLVCQNTKDLFKSRNLKQSFIDYYLLHEENINELERYLRKNNAVIPQRTYSLQGKLNHTWTLLRSVFGEKSALKAMKKYEERNIHIYTKALRNVIDHDFELNALIQKHLRQEKRHCHDTTKKIENDA